VIGCKRRKLKTLVQWRRRLPFWTRGNPVLGLKKGGFMIRKSRALLAPVFVLGAIFLTGSAAPGAVRPTIARTSVQVTKLSNDVLPNLGTFTDLGAVAADQQMNVVIPLKHD